MRFNFPMAGHNVVLNPDSKDPDYARYKNKMAGVANFVHQVVSGESSAEWYDYPNNQMAAQYHQHLLLTGIRRDKLAVMVTVYGDRLPIYVHNSEIMALQAEVDRMVFTQGQHGWAVTISPDGTSVNFRHMNMGDTDNGWDYKIFDPKKPEKVKKARKSKVA